MKTKARLFYLLLASEMGAGMGTAADGKIESYVISIAYRLSMAEVATWSTANSKNPAFFTVNARQFWLRRTLLKFEERAAEFPPNLGKTSEGLIDQSNLKFIENAIAPLRPESQPASIGDFCGKQTNLNPSYQ